MNQDTLIAKISPVLVTHIKHQEEFWALEVANRHFSMDMVDLVDLVDMVHMVDNMDMVHMVDNMDMVDSVYMMNMQNSFGSL